MNNFEDSTLFNIGLMLRHTVRIIRKAFNEEKVDLTGEQFGMLSIIAEKDEFIQSDLAAMFDKDKSAILRQIDNLEKQQLIVRKNDEADRRKKFLKVTPEGFEMIKICQAMINKVMIGVEDGIEEADMKTFRKVLIKMQHNAENITKQSENQN